MSGFVYFVETKQKSLDLDGIRELGLGYAFESSPECSEALGDTPTGGRGLFFADHERLGEMRAGYAPDEQSWRDLPNLEGQPRRAIGFWKHRRPTPNDLQRKQTATGLLVRLNDDEMWQIPTVRKWDEQSNEWLCDLPCLYDYDSQGKLCRGQAIEKYRHLWDITAPIASLLFAAETDPEAEEVTDDQAAEAAVELLKANYLVDLPELVVLDVLAKGSLALIVNAAVMKDRLLEWIDTLQKKSDDPSTSTGSTTVAGKKV